jgi:hypothetical protein
MNLVQGLLPCDLYLKFTTTGEDTRFREFYISAINGGELLASRSGRLNPEERNSGNHLSPGSRKETKVWHHIAFFLYHHVVSRGSSVSIVSEYRLDDRSSIPGRGKGLFF